MNIVDDEVFHVELLAMHIYEQDFYKTVGYAVWFKESVELRQKYRLRAKLLIQEAREPRG